MKKVCLDEICVESGIGGINSGVTPEICPADLKRKEDRIASTMLNAHATGATVRFAFEALDLRATSFMAVEATTARDGANSLVDIERFSPHQLSEHTSFNHHPRPTQFQIA